MIIALEGLDGAGKTVQTGKLVRWMHDNGIGMTRFDFPDYAIQSGVDIQRCLSDTDASYRTLHKLMAQNRLDRLPDIQGALSRGDVLVMNRYCDSNIVYGMANGFEHSWLAGLDVQMPHADLTILLSITVEHSFKRKRIRDNLEAHRGFMTRVFDMYRQVSADNNWACVDGTLAPDMVHQRILDHVKPILGIELAEMPQSD